MAGATSRRGAASGNPADWNSGIRMRARSEPFARFSSAQGSTKRETDDDDGDEDAGEYEPKPGILFAASSSGRSHYWRGWQNHRLSR